VKLYSYVVEHDNGHAPNPYFGVCTLCRCKFEGRRNIVPLAKEGDWVIGTGGASKRSAGHGKLVYAMRVDEKLTRWEYFTDRRFKQKKPVKTGTYEQTRGDNVSPHGDFEKHEQFALLSRHFYYWPAPGSEDTELGVLMELEVGHGETEVYPRVQA
jgi:Nucleotide modification associated domain 2